MTVSKKETPYKYGVSTEMHKTAYVERFRANRPYEDYAPTYDEDDEEDASKPEKKSKKDEEDDDGYDDEYDY